MSTAAKGGFVVGNYVAYQRLGAGGMAEVWLARRDGAGGFAKQVVIKKLLPHLAADAALVEMFLNEARLSALLRHPNVVQVFELAEDRDGYFIVMEYVPGRSLRRCSRACAPPGSACPSAWRPT